MNRIKYRSLRQLLFVDRRTSLPTARIQLCKHHDMPRPRQSVQAFLALTKNEIQASNDQLDRHVNFIVGNESADLDSICGAIVYAYMRTYFYDDATVYVPLLNIPREDLTLRPELAFVLRSAGLKSDGSELTTLDDINRLEQPRFTLVDHNALTGKLERYADSVRGCIDHHDDENVVPEIAGEPRIIQKCGSCTSLIIEACLDAWKKASVDENPTEWEHEIAALSLAPILIDTNNLKDKDKVTQTDLHAAEFLQTKFPNTTREDYFTSVSKAKTNVDYLSTEDLLRKDYKEWNEGSCAIGIASVVKSIQFLINPKDSNETQQLPSLLQDFEVKLQKFAKPRNLNILAIMTTSTNAQSQFQRELLLYAMNEKAIRVATDFATGEKDVLGLETSKALDVQWEAVDSASKMWVWQQKELGMSRKQVAPLLRKAAKDGAEGE